MATVINPFVAVDGNGNVRANAKLYFYMTGTTTPQNTYSDAALSAVNTNPVVADSNGLFPAIYLGDPPTFVAYKAILKTSADVTVWTADPIAGAPIAAPLSAAILRGYLSGLTLSRTSATVLGVGAGVAVDSTNTAILSLVAGSINCATVGADGLDAGALANTTWYHVFAIGKTDGTVARLASTSATSPTMPSGYTLKRRIGSFKTNGSAQILAFTQSGDVFIPTSAVSETNLLVTYAANAQNTTKVLLGVPSGIEVMAEIAVQATAGGGVWGCFVGAVGQISGGFPFTAAGGTGAPTAGLARALVNTSQQVDVSVTNTSGGVAIQSAAVVQWIDTRGRLS